MLEEPEKTDNSSPIVSESLFLLVTGIEQSRVNPAEGEKPSKNGFAVIFLPSVFILTGTKAQERTFSCHFPFIYLLYPWEEHCTFPAIP